MEQFKLIAVYDRSSGQYCFIGEKRMEDPYVDVMIYSRVNIKRYHHIGICLFEDVDLLTGIPTTFSNRKDLEDYLNENNIKLNQAVPAEEKELISIKLSKDDGFILVL